MRTNFGGLDENSKEISKIVILPVPYDGTSTWQKGADKGPIAIIEASCNMELYDIETDTQVYGQGIFTAPFITENESPEKMVDKVKVETSKYLNEGKFIVIIGGEHSVSIGSIYAHAEKFNNLTVLQIDAHADCREEYGGTKNNHASVMARAREKAKIVQVGIRSMDSSENVDKENVFFMKDIINDNSWQDKVLPKLTGNVYITIDLDGFDPSIMPSTGTPEPGGLLWWDVLKLLKKVCYEKNVVGFDVVELCPNEHNKAPNFLAAKLIYKLLSYNFS